VELACFPHTVKHYCKGAGDILRDYVDARELLFVRENKYIIINDKNGRWTNGKAFPNFCVLQPFEEILRGEMIQIQRGEE